MTGRQGRVFTFQHLSSSPNITCAFSTKQFGDLRIKNSINENPNLSTFLDELNVCVEDLLMLQQIHGSKIAVVKKRDRGKVFSGVDGLITCEADILLGVQVADCLPILYWDPFQKIIAAVHAGWQGTFEDLAQKTVMKMTKLGSQAYNIIVCIGPHIKVCCYDVPWERLRFFQEKFPQDKKIFQSKDKKYYLDLTHINLQQLMKAGIRKENIEVSSYCTGCSDYFFSHHVGKQPESRMLAIIGRSN